MSRIEWGARPPEQLDGLDRGVLYFGDDAVAWNGLTSVIENTSREQNQTYYFDGQLLTITQDEGDFEASVEAYTYPDVLESSLDYFQDNRHRRYGLSYRTVGGSGHKIHVVYNATLKRPSKHRASISDALSPTMFSWTARSSVVEVPGARPTSRLVIDEENTHPSLLSMVERILYGTETENPRLPTPSELVSLFESFTALRVVYNGDGTWTAEGPDDMVQVNPDGTFHISSPSASFLNDSVFVVDSY